MSRFVSSIFKIAVVALLLITAAVCKADGISENFNELSTGLNATNLGASTVTKGAVDLIGGGLFGYLCVSPASVNCVDLMEAPGLPGKSVQQL